MVVSISQVSWGAFGGYEGCAYYGRNFFTASPDDSFETKCFAVVASAEGSLSSINMYDRAVISVGAIQWTELTDNKVSEMIGFVASQHGPDFVRKYLKPALDLSGAELKQNASGKWRFYLGDVEVKGEQLARKLFANGAGKVGTWSEASKLRARTWCACIASLFQDPLAERAQVDFTAPQLFPRFVWKNSRDVLFAPGSPETGYGGALKALLVGYAINLPAIADRMAARIGATLTQEKWSTEWCLEAMRVVVFDPNVPIWPGRYDAKRPVIEKLFGVTLPKTSKDLQARKWPALVKPETKPETEGVSEVQAPNVTTVSVDTDASKREIVVHGVDEPLVDRSDVFATVLQWMPMAFGLVGQLVNAIIQLFRGRHP